MPTFVRQQQISHPIGAQGRLQVRVTDADLRLRASGVDDVQLRATFEIRAGSDEEADRLFEDAPLGHGARRLRDVPGFRSVVRRPAGRLAADDLSVRGRLVGARVQGIGVRVLAPLERIAIGRDKTAGDALAEEGRPRTAPEVLLQLLARADAREPATLPALPKPRNARARSL